MRRLCVWKSEHDGRNNVRLYEHDVPCGDALQYRESQSFRLHKLKLFHHHRLVRCVHCWQVQPNRRGRRLLQHLLTLLSWHVQRRGLCIVHPLRCGAV